MNYPTIAICVSGQIRTPIETLKKIAEEAEAINADVFMSVWSERGEKTFEGAVGPKNIRRIIGVSASQLLPDNWLGKMREIFPEYKTFFPKKSPVTENDLDKLLPDARIEIDNDGSEFNLNASDSNSLRMLFKIWRANQMKCEAEKRRGHRYAKVVRVRADMLFNGTVVRNLDTSDELVFVQGHAGDRQNYVNDTIWMTTSEKSDEISEIYHRCISLRDSGWAGIHRELYDQITSANLRAQPANLVKSGIGIFGEADENVSLTVRDSLLNAVTAGNFDSDVGGGQEFCNLVSLVVAQNNKWISDGIPSQIDAEIIAQLDVTEKKNRHSFLQALMYLSNICVQDSNLPASDRIELLFRVLGYYTSRQAQVFLDVRIIELPDLFANAPQELQTAICSDDSDWRNLETEVAREIAKRFDAVWRKRIQHELATVKAEVKVKIFENAGFVIQLHQILSRSGSHKNALDLAEKWVESMPDNWRGYDLLAGSLQALGQDEQALAVFGAAEINAEPHNRIQELKGRLLAKLGNSEGAKAAFEKSLALPGCNIARVTDLLTLLDNE